MGIKPALEMQSIAEAPSAVGAMPFSSNSSVQKELFLTTLVTGTGLRRIIDFAKGLSEVVLRSLEAYPEDTGLRRIVYVAKGVGVATEAMFVSSMKELDLRQSDRSIGVLAKSTYP